VGSGHERLGGRLGLMQDCCGNCVDACRADAAGADQATLGKAQPLEEHVIAGENVGKEGFAGVPLGKDEN